MTNEHKKQWFACGLKFSCKRCSACCRHDPGFVYLSEKDLEKLVLQTKIDKKSFINKYCRWCSDDSLSLKEKPNKDCIFWDGSCTVYETRPLQCRTFPFWKSIIASQKNWEAAAGECPGMNSGKLHSAKEIEKHIELRTQEQVILK